MLSSSYYASRIPRGVEQTELGIPEQLARGFVSNLTFNAIEPYKDQGQGGMAETVGGLAGMLTGMVPVMRGAGMVPAALGMLAKGVGKDQALKTLGSAGWRALPKSLSPQGYTLAGALGGGVGTMAPWAVDTFQGEPTDPLTERASMAALGMAGGAALSHLAARKLGQTPSQQAREAAKDSSDNIFKKGTAKPPVPPPEPANTSDLFTPQPGKVWPETPPGAPWRSPGPGAMPESDDWLGWLRNQKSANQPPWKDWLGGQQLDEMLGQKGPGWTIPKIPPSVMPKNQFRQPKMGEGYLPIGRTEIVDPGGTTAPLGGDLARSGGVGQAAKAAGAADGLSDLQVRMVLRNAGIVAVGKSPEEMKALAAEVLSRKALTRGTQAVEGSPLPGYNVTAAMMEKALPQGSQWIKYPEVAAQMKTDYLADPKVGKTGEIIRPKRIDELMTGPGMTVVPPGRIEVLNPQPDVDAYRTALKKMKNLYQVGGKGFKGLEPAKVDPDMYKRGIMLLRQGKRYAIPPRVRAMVDVGEDVAFRDPDLWWMTPMGWQK